MKTNYFTKVENKYVFNVSLIFWHLFIALSTLVIVVSLVIFLWSLIPASQSEVEKQPYPAKQQYPEPVKVALNELQLEVTKEEAPPVAPEQIQTTPTKTQQPVEDTKGKEDYESSLNTLKTLIPPSKYSWQGSGYWTYPYGERYWTVYRQEKYRQWNTTEPGIEDKLNIAYRRTNATNFPDKKMILDEYIGVVKLLTEEKRLDALQFLISNVADNISQNINVCNAITKLVGNMPKDDNVSYINKLAYLGKINPTDGSAFIDYVGTIIDRFDVPNRADIIDRIITGYNDYFGRRFPMLKEATDLFLPLVPKIKAENQSKAVVQYYGVFRNKNYLRDNAIAEIENEYQQSVNAIEAQYAQDQLAAQIEYSKDKMTKTEYRLKSLTGIGGGIILIVLIAVVLVFFSIQRSVKKIEEKIIISGENVNPMV